MSARAAARSRSRSGSRSLRVLPIALAALSCCTCAASPPPAPAPPLAAPPPPAPPLERVCQDALPLPVRTIGALVRLLNRTSPGLTVEQRDCRKGDSWPIAYATGESASTGRAPFGFEVLRMTGDALLTFDEQNRESPAVNLCRWLELTLDAAHRVRAVALWDAGDERAFDPAHPDRATATLAWLELVSRAPSECALGRQEADGETGDPLLREPVRCALRPTPLRPGPGCPPAAASRSSPSGPAAEAQPQPTAADVERAVLATHRFSGPGRSQVEHGFAVDLRLERSELCLYEPPPAERDVCLAEYRTASGERWYGRADVTRTGAGNVKNYVDSYLTFMLLERMEAERKGTSRPAAPAPTGPPSRSKK